jgi:hypothetical protein
MKDNCVSMQGKIWAQVMRPILAMGPNDEGRVICLSDLGNILAYYLDKTTLISLY